MTNRTASLTHNETQSDAAYEAGHFEPLPSTIATIDLIKRQNAALRTAQARLGRLLDYAERRALFERVERDVALEAEQE